MFWNKKHKTDKHKKGKSPKAKSVEDALSKNKQSQSLAGGALRARVMCRCAWRGAGTHPRSGGYVFLDDVRAG